MVGGAAWSGDGLQKEYYNGGRLNVDIGEVRYEKHWYKWQLVHNFNANPKRRHDMILITMYRSWSKSGAVDATLKKFPLDNGKPQSKEHLNFGSSIDLHVTKA